MLGKRRTSSGPADIPNRLGLWHDRMPTILRIGRLRVMVYPNDHRPAHVHAIGAGQEAIFVLGCPHGPVALRGSFGFTTSELNRISAKLDGERKALCAAWRRIHDDHRG